MFNSIAYRPLGRTSFAAASKSLGGQRNFGFISVHSKFPATMYRFQTQRKSGLLDRKSLQNDESPEDYMEVSKEGLVYPKVSNGVLFMPNTFSGQEWIRTSFDYYCEDLENGKTPSEPLIFSIKKGTPIPDSLILFREFRDRFSLQPSRPMTLNDLNNLLSEFYSKSAVMTDAEQWMEDNEYDRAFAADAFEEWSRQ